MSIGTFQRARSAAVVIAAGAIFLGGCANQQATDGLRDSNRSMTERNLALQRNLQEAQNEIALLQRERTALDAALGEHQRQLADARGDLSKQEAARLKLVQDLQSLQLGPLDEATSAALAQLADKNPDLIKFDPALGMLRFASDLTFDSGQDAVKDSAKSSLEALGRILTTSAASSYEIMIVGHTDSQAVSAATRDRGHASNTHLSAHRAISVRNVLAGMGVPRDRMLVAGWGESRPAIPNNQNGNTPPNRRVEIFLTRPTGTSLGDPGNAEAPPPDAATPRQIEVTK